MILINDPRQCTDSPVSFCELTLIALMIQFDRVRIIYTYCTCASGPYMHSISTCMFHGSNTINSFIG